MVGIYHSFVRGHNRDTRVHKLFIIVSGGCGKASDEFYNTVLDCHGHANAKTCVMSEEAWWLRRASYRSRCRIIAECAKAFGISVKNIKDIHSFDSAVPASTNDNDGESSSIAASSGIMGTGGVRMAVPTIDTVTHDMCISSTTHPNDTVHLFDGCVNINDIRNGVLCSMHPSEGYWIFKGAQNRAHGSNAYGISWNIFKEKSVIDAMPTSVIKVHHTDLANRKISTNTTQSMVGSSITTTSTPISSTTSNTVKDRNNAMVKSLQYAVASTTDSHAIVRVSVVEKRKNGVEIGPFPEKERLYQFFDEEYLSMVSRCMGWPRDRGVVELIPIVVGMGVLD